MSNSTIIINRINNFFLYDFISLHNVIDLFRSSLSLNIFIKCPFTDVTNIIILLNANPNIDE